MRPNQPVGRVQVKADDVDEYTMSEAEQREGLKRNALIVWERTRHDKALTCRVLALTRAELSDVLDLPLESTASEGDAVGSDAKIEDEASN